MWKTGKYSAILIGLVTLIYLVFVPQIISRFTLEYEVIKNGSICLRVIVTDYIFYACGMVVINSFNGAGDIMTSTLFNFICFWLLQLPFAYLMAISSILDQQVCF